MVKVINDFKIDLSSMAAAGVVRQFSVIGDNGAIFSLEVKNEDNKYYNFSTNTFTTTYNRLKNKKLVNGIYKGYINFPAVGDPDQYDIYLFAESTHDTNHATYSEIRFDDGSIDINSSTGSNSNLLTKVIYQYDDVVITLSAVAPDTTHSTTNFSSMSVSTDTITVGRGNTVGKTAFSVAVTATTDKSLQISRQPTIDDLVAYTSTVFGDAVKIDGEDIWAGTVRSTDTVNGASEASTTVTMDTAVADKMKVGDRVTGTGIASTSVVTVASISGTYRFVASEALTISDGVTLTFTPPYYYRYNVAAASSMHTITSGMVYIDPDHPLIPRTTVGSYEDTTTYTTQIYNDDGSIEEVENTVVNVSVPALDPLGYKPTITNGVVTKQLGNITFSSQLINDIDDTNNKYFYAYGSEAIKAIHDTEIKLTDLKVELTGVTTTTTAAVNNSTTIPVAERKGTVVNVSTISGIGIDSSVANPTVASATDEGAGNWTASAAQTLESGVTLTVGGTGKVATITGNIEFVNVDDTSFSLYFDVEKFLTAS
tara:strand:- start:525 stop:2144 length:1620 start_codon:yes stop_codon:yes gene_type:complete